MRCDQGQQLKSVSGLGATGVPGQFLEKTRGAAMLARHEVIQPYLDIFNEPNYLEIGVSRGVTFHAVKASRKVAVDPQFQIKPESREPDSEYHEVTSDKYFNDLASDVNQFDVIYLDGLHTFEQTLRDLMNAIDVLRRDGVIVVDDVSPNSYHSSLRDHRETVAVRQAINGTDESWMGDTYRLVYFIQSFLPRFYYATVQENHGQLVMWRAKRTPGLFVERQVEDIARLEFRHVVMQRAAFNFRPNAEIVDLARRAILGMSTQNTPARPKEAKVEIEF
jgi:hypothetical protein